MYYNYNTPSCGNSSPDSNFSKNSGINKDDYDDVKLAINKDDGTKTNGNLKPVINEDDGKSNFINISNSNTSNLTLIVHQVDDFLIANKDNAEYERIGRLVQERMTFPLNKLGTIQKFNEVDVE